MKKRIISLLLTLVLAFTLVPAAFADSSDCGISYCTCSGHCSSGYKDYQYESSTMHSCIAYCTGCGKTSGVRQLGAHNMVNGVCTECGYSDGTGGGGGGGDWEPDICYHWSTYRSWSGCRWYEYCWDCGALVDSGVSHGATVYGAWQYYSATQHRRTKTCSDCGYSTYEYADHSLSYGSWSSYSDAQHRRKVSCSGCSYSTYEYADHADANGDGFCDGCDKQLAIYVDVKLDACGGVLADDSVTVTYGDAYGELPEPTREGYIFDGWFTAETGGELVEKNTEVGSKTAHTLYAHWTQIKIFSVTVPAGLPLAVTENGEVTASTDAAIANNSTCDVRVTGVTLRTENGWTLVPFSYNMAAAKVDSKLIGFAIGGAASATEGDAESLALSGDWSIASGGTLPLDYDAKVSATSVGIDEQVLTVVFVVEEVT
uniref:InlB B-repeat-containing protein n=1 Tax=Candidatus Scatomorpha intestinigallinarum TaxID=2840923 RepID=UPI0040260D39